MAEDYSIQQQKPSSAPYTLTGAVIGGLGTGWAANHFTKPKYGSYDQIIAETQDKDKFDKKIADAPEDDKKFLEQAKEMGNKEAAAGAEYDREFEEYKKVNGSDKVITDDYKKLVSAEEEAEKALNDKKNKLINAEVERIKSAGASDKSATIEKALNNKSRQIANATKRYETLKASGASAEDVKKAEERVIALQKEAEELSKRIAEKFEYGSLAGDALEAKKGEVANAYKLAINDRVAQNLKLFDSPLESADAKLLREFTENKTAITQKKAALDKTMGELGEFIGKDIKGIYGTTSSMVHPKVFNAFSIENNQVNRLTTLLEAFKKVSEAPGAPHEFTFEQFFESLKKLGTGEPLGLPAKKDIVAELTKYLKETKGIDDKEIAAIKKLMNGEITEESIKTALDNATARRAKIEGLNNQAIEIEKSIQELSDESKKIGERLQARNVYVKDGALIDKATGKPVKPTPVAHEKPAAVKLPSGVTEPKDAKIEYTSKSASGLSEEEIRKQAEAAVQEDRYKAEADAFNKAKAAREEAYGKLEDGAKKSEDEIKEAFNKAKGYESREKFIEGKVEAAKKEFKETFSKQLDRKWGFAEHTKSKITIAALGGAIVLGGLFKAFSPKSKS